MIFCAHGQVSQNELAALNSERQWDRAGAKTRVFQSRKSDPLLSVEAPGSDGAVFSLSWRFFYKWLV